jgi:hypothetical protein
MTVDVIGLCARLPDVGTMLAALQAAGPHLHVDTQETGSLIQLCDNAGGVLVSIESPQLVQVPGEAERLLGITEPLAYPLWWVEARSPGQAGAAIARRYVAALISVTGGTSWQSR